MSGCANVSDAKCRVVEVNFVAFFSPPLTAPLPAAATFVTNPVQSRQHGALGYGLCAPRAGVGGLRAAPRRRGTAGCDSAVKGGPRGGLPRCARREAGGPAAHACLAGARRPSVWRGFPYASVRVATPLASWVGRARHARCACRRWHSTTAPRLLRRDRRARYLPAMPPARAPHCVAAVHAVPRRTAQLHGGAVPGVPHCCVRRVCGRAYRVLAPGHCVATVRGGAGALLELWRGYAGCHARSRWRPCVWPAGQLLGRPVATGSCGGGTAPATTARSGADGGVLHVACCWRGALRWCRAPCSGCDWRRQT